MKKWIKITSIVSASLLSATSIGVLVPMVIREMNGLNNFLPAAGPAAWNTWNQYTKINYVALGDSETAGYNGFMQKDYLSYADFLANDLKNSGKLDTYSNFAVSGAKIGDQQELFGENHDVEQAVKNANLISVTIGANDLLSFVKMLDLPFTTALSGSASGIFSGNVNALNEFRDSIFGIQNGRKTNAGVTAKSLEDNFSNSLKILQKMIETNNYGDIITLQPDFKNVIFDLIKRNFAMFIHDLHTLAPHAQILVLGHAMPFAQWPTSVLNDRHADIDNKTILDEYTRMVDSIKSGAKLTARGHDDYVTFKSVDSLPIYKSSDPSHDKNGNTFDSYIKHTDYKSDSNFYVQNAMPNAGDIHPSTFGHELIGNSLFSLVSPHLSLNNADTLNYYTMSKRVTYDGITVNKEASNAKNWTALDEEKDNSKNSDISASARSTAEGMYDFLRSGEQDSKYRDRSPLYKELTTNLFGDGKTIDILASVQDWSFFGNCIYDDQTYKFAQPFISQMASGHLLKGVQEFILAAENQVDVKKPTSNINNPQLEPMITSIVESFEKIGTSQKVSSKFSTFTSGIAALINSLRVSQANDFSSNLITVNKLINDLLDNPALNQGLKDFLKAIEIQEKSLSQIEWIQLINPFLIAL